MRAIKLPLLIFFALVANAQRVEDGSPRCPDTPSESQVRAGCPQVVSPHARPSNTPNYGGYYVGGGAAVHGQPRRADEGTWGWDYAGLIPKYINLHWWHGAHKQGGGGAYATDHH